MNCAGKIRVYKGEYGYSTSFGVKEKDEYVANVYLNVQFSNGTEPKMKEGSVLEIEVVDSFLAGWQSKNGKTGLKLVVLEWEKVKTSSKKTTR